MKKSTRTTLKDLANHLGVSKTIVSKVLNDHPDVRVSDELRLRIQETSEALNYTPLRSAQALTTMKTGQIAFLLSAKTTLGLANNYYGEILAGVNETCRERGYHCLVDVYDMSTIEDFVFPKNIRTRNIDGCILLGTLNDQVMDRFSIVDIPTIAIGGRPDMKTVPVITSDLGASINRVLEYSMKMGHYSIWLGFGNASKAAKETVESLIRGRRKLDARLLENRLAQQNPDEFDYGSDCARQWMELPLTKRPTLIYGADQWCVGFVSTIQRSGFSFPKDLSVLAGCDSPLVRWHYPAISAFSNEKCFKYGSLGCALLLDLIEEKITNEDALVTAAEIDIEPHLIERDSVLRRSHEKEPKHA